MFRFGMQARELGGLMAARARGDGGDALRAVGAMARLATARDLAVRGVLLLLVAVGARFERGEAGVRLVAVGAGLMT